MGGKTRKINTYYSLEGCGDEPVSSPNVSDPAQTYMGRLAACSGVVAELPSDSVARADACFGPQGLFAQIATVEVTAPQREDKD